MEERKGTDNSQSMPAARPPPRKAMSYSQPLSRDAILSSAARRNTLRKHSLDEDDPSTRCPSLHDDPLTSSCSAFQSADHPCHRHHHSSSLEDIHFPPPVPAAQPFSLFHAPSAGSFGITFSLDHQRVGP